MDYTFELGNKGYRCDKETLEAVRSAVKMYEATNDILIIDIAMGVGLEAGVIVPMTDDEAKGYGI